MKKKFIAVFSLFLAETSLLSGCDMLFNSLSAEEKALKEKYSAVYADVSQEMLAIASAKTGVAATAMKEDAQSSHVASTGAFVYFISELYKSDAFIVSEAPVTFTCTYQEYQEEYLLGMYTALDETTGSVLGEIYVETKNVMSGEKGYGYIYIEVGYDFKAEKIIDFDYSTGKYKTNAYESFLSPSNTRLIQILIVTIILPLLFKKLQKYI